jgi:hypothetical protein
MNTSKTQLRCARLAHRCLLLICAVCLSGCVVGYRHQTVSDEVVNEFSQSATVEGSSDMVYLGLILDFRILRFGTPAVGGNVELAANNERGAYRDEYNQQMNGFQLDVPLVSFWSEEEGFGYPGVLKHRHSVDLWVSGTYVPVSPPNWWTDASLVYYNHNLFAVRVFGGYGQIPFDGTLTGYSNGSQTFDMFETTVGGPTYGVEFTILAGEQALDFINWFGNAQNAAAEEASGGR